ncbi:VanZ family protein [Paenibacillus campi]|uniref:VanZ family protein n=1 Tax=Paenibacillus campi TaxID=3106031 RepID=UPI002AFEC30E|nr:VanZ family protein [Paenibacillus sp. SGZ-1014]
MRSTLPSYRSHSARRPEIVPLVIWSVLTLGWMTFMFMMSNQPYQEQDVKPLLASWIAEPSLAAITPLMEFSYGGYTVTGSEPYAFWEFFIRKGGHVSEFAVLTFLLVRVCSQWTKLAYMPLLWAAVMAYGYAATDEWHQTWIAGRTGHFGDTLIDALGIVIVVVVYGIVRYRRHNR